MARDMPAWLYAAIEARRATTAELKDSAARISGHYRQLGASRQVIGGAADAVAYALSRMPATFAAVSAVLAELADRAPEFAPRTLLDAGAGPGTASWVVAEAYPGLETAVLRDHNQAFLALAAELGAKAGRQVATDLAEIGRGGPARDLVVCAYALTELDDAAMLAAADSLWAETGGVLAIVEPGRPRDYQRLMAVRERLIGAGAKVLAPCPHEAACPLVEPDWCHFAVRLNRRREHRQLKGGTLGYEDEKFSYLIVARDGIGERAAGRVIKPVAESKFAVTLPLCGADGLEDRVIASRDKAAFKAAKKLEWGHAI